ncbi:MAG: single-stranded DNA-binding protein [Anaerolineales bacterium]|nr:single-stranded DNA-binding protein [Anaerolineales bacterium]
MLGLNKVQLIGRLGKDPEIRITPKEKKVASFSMAVNRSYKDQDGKTIEDTQWINVEAWETLANIIESYLQKGSQVYIEGRLKTEKYQKNGETKYFTKVVVWDMLMLGRSRNEGEVPDEDDIPF